MMINTGMQFFIHFDHLTIKLKPCRILFILFNINKRDPYIFVVDNKNLVPDEVKKSKAMDVCK
jgi:hypothetical protein